MLISFCCGLSQQSGFKRITGAILELGAGFGSFNIAMNLISCLQEAGDKNGATPWRLGSNPLVTPISFFVSNVSRVYIIAYVFVLIVLVLVEGFTVDF
jgi:hypothetical protein